MFEKEMAISFFMNLMLCFSLDTVPGKILPQLQTDVSGGLTAWAVKDILLTLKLVNFEARFRPDFFPWQSQRAEWRMFKSHAR